MVRSHGLPLRVGRTSRLLLTREQRAALRLALGLDRALVVLLQLTHVLLMLRQRLQVLSALLVGQQVARVVDLDLLPRELLRLSC